MRIVLPRRTLIRSLTAAAVATIFSGNAAPMSAATEALDATRVLKLRSGATMPFVGLGTWEADPGVVGQAVKASLAAGCRHIDCAPVYRNEPEVGQALAASGVPRSELFVTSKLWNDRRRPQDVRDALERTLTDLGTEYVDLYLIHWPVVWAKDSVMRPDRGASLREAWQTMESLVDEGKCRHIGVSNFKESEVDEVLSYARIPPAVNQIELHPRLPQTNLVRHCQEKGIAVTAYSPLGRGNVKGAGLLSEPTVAQIAEARGVSPASVLLRWNLQRGVVVIPKSSSPARAAQNAQEPWTFRLSGEEMAALDSLGDGARFCTAPWSTFDDRSRSDELVTTSLTAVASALFSVVSLDVTRR